MSRRTKVLLIVSASVVVVALALALAGPAIYRAVMVSDVADTPEITLESGLSDAGTTAENGDSTGEGTRVTSVDPGQSQTVLRLVTGSMRC